MEQRAKKRYRWSPFSPSPSLSLRPAAAVSTSASSTFVPRCARDTVTLCLNRHCDDENRHLPAELVHIVSLYVSLPLTEAACLREAVELWCDEKHMALMLFGHISYWDTSKVNDMQGLLKDKKNFNDDISQWDVSNVTNMLGMFNTSSSFNQDLSQWDVSNVTDIDAMFSTP